MNVPRPLWKRVVIRLLRCRRWGEHLHWHATQPEHYWHGGGGNISDPTDWISCPYCRKTYRGGA